jgi:hypothetical protein
VAAPLALVGGAAAATYSVPRYHLLIVTTYLVLLITLGVTTVRAGQDRTGQGPPASGRPCATRGSGAAALAATGLAVLGVPAFSYLAAEQVSALGVMCGSCALLGALAVASPWRRGPDAALALAAASYCATAAAVIRLDPAPRIDVWYTLQGAADGLARGENMYEQVLVGPPGAMSAFTYLPWTAVLLAPGRWLGGDVRWALAAVTLATASALAALAGRRHPAAAVTAGASRAATADRRAGLVSAALLLLLPGTLTQVEQAWTEPLLLALLTGAVLAVDRGATAWAVAALALALASKQHILLLLPVLAAGPGFGVRRAGAAGAGAAVLVLPWFLANPAAMWDDTVRLLVGFHPITFADTAYIAVMNETGLQPPFWLTGIIVMSAVAGAALAVRRADPTPATVLRWCAFVLFVASFVNKQAFYNQYWLVAGLVLASWPLVGDHALIGPRPHGPGPAPDADPAPAGHPLSGERG